MHSNSIFLFIFYSYSNVLTGHLKALALRHMPPNLQSLDPKQTGMLKLPSSAALDFKVGFKPHLRLQITVRWISSLAHYVAVKSSILELSF